MRLRELFLRCSGSYAYEELLNCPRGKEMQRLYAEVRASLSKCFEGGGDAAFEIEYRGERYGYSECFRYRPYGLRFEDACRAVIAVFEDYPLAYFVNSYQVFGNPEKGLILYALAEEYKSGAERSAVSAKIGGEIANLLSPVPLDLTDLEKAKRVYERLCAFAEYDREAGAADRVDIPAHSAAGVFCRRKAVCEGLSKAYQSAMLLLSVECLTFQGVYLAASGGGSYQRNRHAWNLVKIGGRWRVVDLTRGLAGADGFPVSHPAACYCAFGEAEKDTHAYRYQFPAPKWE